MQTLELLFKIDKLSRGIEELAQILREERSTTKSQFDLFLESVSKREIRLVPWQKNIARRIYQEPLGAGKSTLIALLFAADKEARKYYESGLWQSAT